MTNGRKKDIKIYMADYAKDIMKSGPNGARAITALLAGGAGLVSASYALQLFKDRLRGDDDFPDDPTGGGTGDGIVVEYIKETAEKASEFALPMGILGLVMIAAAGALWATRGPRLVRA